MSEGVLKEGDQLRFPWPCPICGRLSTVVKGYQIERGDPVSVFIVSCECPACELDGNGVTYDIEHNITADELKELEMIIESTIQDGENPVDVINQLLMTGGSS